MWVPTVDWGAWGPWGVEFGNVQAANVLLGPQGGMSSHAGCTHVSTGQAFLWNGMHGGRALNPSELLLLPLAIHGFNVPSTFQGLGSQAQAS